MQKIFYLGPKASYCEQAQKRFAEYLGNQLEQTPMPTILATIKELSKPENLGCYGVLPIENSVDGIVRETVDNLLLLKYTDVKIIAETSLPIKHCLAGFSKKLKDIKTVISHPQAIAQCYGFISEKLNKDVEIRHESSTAKAISNLSHNEPSIAAIGSEYAANLYNTPIIKKQINDKDSNTTRFILLGTKSNKISGIDKTGFSFSTPNTPGALYKILGILEKYQINMCYIDSRPSKKTLGEYVFYVDIDGHALSKNISLAIFEILQNVKDFQYFGSYTRI